MSVFPNDSSDDDSRKGSTPVPIAARITVPDFAARKTQKRPIVMVTAYDAWQARLADSAGADALLVGDSVGMTTLGQTDTLAVTLAAMTHHTQAVASGQAQNRRSSNNQTIASRSARTPSASQPGNDEGRGARRALLVADLPFGSYGASVEQGVLSAVALMQAGAQAVKIEGAGRIALETVERLVAIGVPVMGHIGLTPQAAHRLGGFRTQGKTVEEVARLRRDLDALTGAGIFAVVVELVPADVARDLTEHSAVPTIGIGAGPHCDGQVQVLHDLLGLSPGPTRKHAHRYLDGATLIEEALAQYVRDVRAGDFPTLENAP